MDRSGGLPGVALPSVADPGLQANPPSSGLGWPSAIRRPATLLPDSNKTFIDSVCGLAIESNPGVLINASKSLDGVSLLKTKRLEREVIENAIEDIAFSHPAPQTAL